MYLNKSSRYGLFAVVMMAEKPDSRVSAANVASAFDVSESHVAKVLQQLARARIVSSVRGVRGGYQLAIEPRSLTMLNVVEALEGPMNDGCYGCESKTPALALERCRYHGSCAIQGVLEEIGQQVYYTLKSVTIAALLTRSVTEIAQTT